MVPRLKRLISLYLEECQMRKPGWQEYHDSIRERQFSVTDLVRSLGIWHFLGVSVTLSLCMKIHLQPTDEEEFNVWEKLHKEEDAVKEENVQKMKQQFMAPHEVSKDGCIQMKEETPLDSSVEFMRIWRKYDADSSGFISAAELCNFLRDLFLHHKKAISEAKLEEYTGTMMKIFDKNKDGRLDLNDLARILALQENFLLQFKMDACSSEERKRDFEKIFAHYDVSKTGALEGPEVDGFVKDMMELVQPNIRGVDLDKFREILLRHCDVNKDGKIQKSELALCLGLKINP
uniref:Secretagogin, EF-hand calcium binding protein n=1 Tax=Ovis aries TaxID=9940 RepID=A0AC11E9J1_SHEEP